VSGPLFESIVYVPPVAGALDYMTEAGRTNQFINPTSGGKLYEFGVLNPEADEEIAALFVEATQL